MSFVDFEPQPQQPPFDLWENPHPRGFIAMLKRSLNMIPDMVNGSIAATGAPPSTEEEAFLYNLARDRGIAGAFSAASTFGPAAPQFVRAARDAASRAIPQALERDAPRHLNGPGTGNMPGPAVLPSPDRFRTNPSGWPSPGSSVPSVLPPVAGSAPSGGLLARLRELDAMERQAAAGTGSSAPVRDPNFRQLSRFPVLPTLEQTGSIATDLLDIPDFLRRTPRAPGPDSIVTETDEPPNTSDSGGRKGAGRKGGRGGGGGGGGGGGDGSGGKRRRPKHEELCERRETEERNRCYNYEDDPIHRDYLKACEDRAKARRKLCDKHGGLDHPGPGEWRPGTDAWPGDEETWLNHGR
jgi:uncharacterized membrane protein YgcG